MATLGETQYLKRNINGTDVFQTLPFGGNIPPGYESLTKDQYVAGLQGKVKTAQDFLTGYTKEGNMYRSKTNGSFYEGQTYDQSSIDKYLGEINSIKSASDVHAPGYVSPEFKDFQANAPTPSEQFYTPEKFASLAPAEQARLKSVYPGSFGAVTPLPAGQKEAVLPNGNAIVTNADAPTPGAPATPSGSPAPALALTANLQTGSQGAEVSTLQTLLGGLATDGIFGPKTRAAVMAFQKANGLTVDGIVGSQTMAALNARGRTTSNAPITTPIGTGVPNASVGSPQLPPTTSIDTTTSYFESLNQQTLNLQQQVDTLRQNQITTIQNDKTNAQSELDSMRSNQAEALGNEGTEAMAKKQKILDEVSLAEKRQNANYDIVLGLLGQLQDLTISGNALIAQQKGVTGLASIRNPRITETTNNLIAQTSAIKAGIDGWNGQTDRARQQLQTATASIVDAYSSSLNYYQSVQSFYETGAKTAENKLTTLTKDEKDFMDTTITNFQDKIDTVQANSDKLQEMFLDPTKALTLTRAGITILTPQSEWGALLKKSDDAQNIIDESKETQIVNLDNGNTVLVNKITGKVIKNYGGSSNDTDFPTVVVPTITTSQGNEPISAYKLGAGDDPYIIAQQNGTNMETLERLNPNISDWTKLKVGQVINLPSKTKSILGATGLSQNAFLAITGQLSKLPRDKNTRTLANKEMQEWAIKNNVDTATFAAQYEALNKTVSANIMRNNQAIIAENEILATIENLREAAQGANLGNLKKLNVAKIWIGGELNDPAQETFKVHLTQLRNEFAMYNAAVAGQLDSNGNIREVSKSEMDDIADNIIKNGFATGSIEGFEKAIRASREKMGVVLRGSIDAQNKSVWDLFGVGDQYQNSQNTAPDNTYNGFTLPIFNGFSMPN